MIIIAQKISPISIAYLTECTCEDESESEIQVKGGHITSEATPARVQFESGSLSHQPREVFIGAWLSIARLNSFASDMNGFSLIFSKGPYSSVS